MDSNKASLHSFFSFFKGKWSVLTKTLVGAHSPHVSLEDNAVADGGQQVVEVELVLVVARIPAMLLPRFHQSFAKPDNDTTNGDLDAQTEKKNKNKSILCLLDVLQQSCHLLSRFSIS